MRQFPYSTDVTHRFVFERRRRDFHLVLLVYRWRSKRTGVVVFFLLLFTKGRACGVDKNPSVFSLTHKGAGDVLRHLVPRAAHLRQMRQFSVQHPLKLGQGKNPAEVR